MLIIFGYLKGPVLATFEQYGEMRRDYNPLPALLFWIGVSAFLMGLWISAEFFSSVTVLNSMGVFLIFLSIMALSLPEYVHQFFRFPAWYVDLYERTTHSERRRIAYMWLRSSWKQRLFYNSSDRAFLQWADFIILASVKP